MATTCIFPLKKKAKSGDLEMNGSRKAQSQNVIFTCRTLQRKHYTLKDKNALVYH